MAEHSSSPLSDESKSREQLLRELTQLRAELEVERRRSFYPSDSIQSKSAEPGKNEDRFRMLFENMSEGFALGELVFDDNGNPCDFCFIEVNKAFEKQSGLSTDALGKPMRQVLPQLEKVWIEKYVQVALTGETARFENYNQDLDRHFDVYCYSPLSGRFAILFRDITRQKKAEEKLQQAHGLLRGITQGTEDMIAAEDHQFRYLFFNDAYQREFNKLWGKKIEVGTSMVEVMAPWPEEQQKARELWQRALNGETFQITVEFGPSAKEMQMYDLHFNPVYSSSGKQIGAAHILRNVTDEFRVREELRESEEIFRTIFNQAAIGICRVSFKDARWIDFNEAFGSLLGYTQEELLKIPWPEITHPDDVDLDLIPFRRMAAGELNSYTVEKRYIHKKGHHVWARLTLSLVRDAKGNPNYQIAIVENIAKRKHAEEALRENEERLRVAVEGADLGTWDLDLTTDVATRSLRHDEIWGYSELQPEWGYEIAKRQIVPEDLPIVEEAFHQAARTGSLAFEARVRWPDGSIHWIAPHGRIVYDEEGQPERIIGIIADITERKIAEEALRSLAQFSAENPHPVLRIAVDGTMMYSNDAARDCLVVLGGLADDIPPVIAEIAARAQQSSRTVEMEVTLPDSRTFSFFAVHPNGEEYVNLYGIDLSERKRMELSLRESEARFRGTFENAAVGIAHVGLQGKWLRVNDRLCEITGYSREELLDLSLQDITHPEDLEEDLRQLAQVKRGDIPGYQLEKRYFRKDGQTVWINLTISVQGDHEGQPLYLISIIEDITERKKAEKELADANKEMEAFSYSVSHDLRAPLRAIAGFSSLLRSHAGQLDNEANGYLLRIEAGVEKMNLLIDDMLQLSSVSRQEMVVQEIDLGALAKAIISEFEQEHSERHVVTDISDDLIAQGDARLIAIALSNLLGNAWKYTGNRTDAHIEFGSFLKNGKKVFYIRDNGAGFPMHQLHRLFKPFQRLHAESEFSGTGIGLPIVHRVISRHGGEIWAEGEAGKGAVFYFTLGL